MKSKKEGRYIPKAYHFERDIGTRAFSERADTVFFRAESNSHFVASDMDSLLGEDKALFILMLERFFSHQKERIEVLDSYSKGENYAIRQGRRRIEDEKSDYRIAHNWGGYISGFITSYLLGKPISITNETIETNKDDSPILPQINWDNDTDTLNYELAFDASRYGRAYELHYRGESIKDNIVLIDPREMFVIRDVTVKKDIIGAVHLPIYNDRLYITVYTDKEVIRYEPTDPSGLKLIEKERKAHAYQDVPVVEWWNNRFRTGDFETELSLIDAYDSAQSDTANYMSDLNDALLVVSGDIRNSGLDVDSFTKMKKANALFLESGIDHAGKQTSVRAEYIYKQYDVAGVEAYKNRIAKDIYKLAKIPNLDDESFSGNQSGVAISYKMVGLDQIRSSKESFFNKALRRRYELIDNVHSALNEPLIGADSLRFVFHANMPEDVWKEIQAFINADGRLSQTTLLENATFTETAVELERLQKEAITPAMGDFEMALALGGDDDKDQG